MSKVLQLREKVLKAEEKVAKIEKTIEKHKVQADKKKKVLTDNNWSLDKYQNYGKENHNETYWAVCEYEDKLEAIESSQKKLQEATKVLLNWKEKLSQAQLQERTISNEIPQSMIEAQKELCKNWIKQDIKAREKMLETRRTLSYQEFRKIYKYSTEEALNISDEQIAKNNERDTEAWVLDLYNRVKDITGEVTDTSKLYWGGKSLDGTVIGKDGIARVDTIQAGGYNIQKLHLRVLIKKC